MRLPLHTTLEIPIASVQQVLLYLTPFVLWFSWMSQNNFGGISSLFLLEYETYKDVSLHPHTPHISPNVSRVCCAHFLCVSYCSNICFLIWADLACQPISVFIVCLGLKNFPLPLCLCLNLSVTAMLKYCCWTKTQNLQKRIQASIKESLNSMWALDIVQLKTKKY